MVYDSDRDRTVLLNGATRQFGDEQETWVWDGSAWSRLDIPQPPRRGGAAMAYDEARQEAVLFGGGDPDDESSALGDTWVFDGELWTERAPDTAPPPGKDAEAAYDPVRAEVVMLTVGDPDPRRPDTWVWNGSTWIERSPTRAPKVTRFFNVAWDESRQAVVLYGGWRDGGQELKSTWAWDGVTWTKVRTRHTPPAGTGVSMASSTRGVIAFGGVRGDLFDETWVLHSRTWKQMALDGGPSARMSPEMAYDSTRNQVVLFGGVTKSSLLGDTWLLNRS